MNSFSTRIVLQQFVLWCVVAAVVALLTLLFTVLGTITCAVLMGMMMAAIKNRPLKSLPISLVFPAVIVTMVHFAKVELPGPQRIMLPVLCFAVFWVIYFSTCALVRFEARNQRTTTATTAGTSAQTQLTADAAMRTAVNAGLPEPPAELRLEQLQGKWIGATVPGGNAQTKFIEVAGRRLCLRVVSADGQAVLVAEADLKLET